MPKKIDPAIKEHLVRWVLEHQHEFSSLTAALASVARREGLGLETLRRWVVQAQVDAGDRPGITSSEHEQIRALHAENARLEQEIAILEAAEAFFAKPAKNHGNA